MGLGDQDRARAETPSHWRMKLQVTEMEPHGGAPEGRAGQGPGVAGVKSEVSTGHQNSGGPGGGECKSGVEGSGAGRGETSGCHQHRDGI